MNNLRVSIETVKAIRVFTDISFVVVLGISGLMALIIAKLMIYQAGTLDAYSAMLIDTMTNVLILIVGFKAYFTAYDTCTKGGN